MIGMIGNFLFSGAGKIATGVIAGMMLFMYVRYDARRDERALCNAEALAAENAALKQQARASEEVAKSAVQQAELTAEENKQLEAKVDEFESKLAGTPGCAISDADIKRLRQIK